MDEVVVVEVEKTKREWEDAYEKTIEHITAIQECGKSRRGEEKVSLQRLNGLAQDGLSLLNSLQFNLDLLAPQLPSDDHRELLLGGGSSESTELRRKRQANAGVTSDAESITESLRRSRQLMVQEVERSTNTLVAFDESTGVLKKAESEYKGHRSLLSRTRNLLSTMQRQDVIDRVILIIGFSLFACAVLYVVSKRIGILRLQQMATAAIKARLAGKAANGDATPLVQQFDGGNTVPNVNIHIQQRLHDEL
ncbi:unnamed protein product [Brassica rapa]|uniref:Sec20 C-terminal domain-containing protein n=1 Tax=Brassica campestris TaxID=3711 RepID=A0A3P5ZWX4_BRACM|nr:unnamed protein product [Brassica rapa]VDC82279.1 unnamed protein product [Brassica rapa]